MKTRQEIKALAKQNFQANYWLSVGTVFLIYLAILSSSFLFVGVIIASPLSVGLCHFLLKLYKGEEATLGDAFQDAFTGFGRKLGGMLWMGLFVYLWSMLFIIPGIIKSIAYSFTPYILAEYPNVPATEALKLSMRMTNGRKGEIFVMQLSFIGWSLLDGLTCGLLGIFFVSPYMGISLAGQYHEYKELALKNGVISAEELA